MKITPNIHTSSQTDDYLDLLNYAKQIGDLSWQEEIIAELTCNKKETIQSFILHDEKNVLREKFNAINAELLELFERIELSKDNKEQLRLSEKVWDLQLQRVNIHHKIRALDTLK